jgi:hypothetical protein
LYGIDARTRFDRDGTVFTACREIMIVRNGVVLHFEPMSNAITVRLPEDLAEWLELAARKTGVPKGRIVREQLEKARNSAQRPFLRWAGAIAGPSGLSMRKGFSRK